MFALNPAAAAAPAVSDLAKTDPEYARFFKYFDEEEVAKTVEPILGKAHRHFVILAALLGCGGKEEFEVRLPQALDAGVTPTQVREIVYQATAYLGIGRVRGSCRRGTAGSCTSRAPCAAGRFRSRTRRA